MITKQKTDRKYIVYKHTSPSGKVYIGITSLKPKARWQAGYKDCKAFMNAINKYGWENITHEILASDLSKEDACNLEKMYISIYDSTNREKGYNISFGGEAPLLGISPSAETREKLRQTSKRTWQNEEYRKAHSGKNAYWYGKHTSIESRRKGVAHRNQTGENHPMWGKHHREESKEKMRLAKLGKANEYARKPVLQFDTGGNFIKEYPSISIASEATNTHGSNIAKCLNGERKTTGGYIWKLKETS